MCARRPIALRPAQSRVTTIRRLNLYSTSTTTRIGGVFADLRLLVVGVIVGMAPWQPDFALRGGAVICAVVLGTAIRSVRISTADVVAIAYAALAVTSMMWAVDEDVTALGVKNSVACVVLFLAVRTIVRRRRDVRGIALALVIGCGIGLWQLWQENPYLRQLRLRYDSGAARVGIEGLNYNALAYAFATGAAAVVLLWATVEDRAHRRAAMVTAGLALLALWAGVLLNGTRGAVIAMVVLVVWLLAARFAPRGAFRWLVGVVIGANVVVFTGWLDSWLRTNTARSVRETGDLNGRLRIWSFAREAFWERPFLGHGLDGIVALRGNPLDTAAHNALLDAGVGLGLAGITLFVATLWAALSQAREWPHDQRYLVVGAFIAVSAPITLSGYWSEAPVFWLALGLFSGIGALRAGLDERAGDMETAGSSRAADPRAEAAEAARS